MQPLPRKDSSPDFSNPLVQNAFVRDTLDSKSLLQKELDVNKEEQTLLGKRIALMKDFANNLPSSDPQYSMLRFQIDMDQVEIDELKAREFLLIEKLSGE